MKLVCIALNAIRQAVRMKFAVLFIMLLIALVIFVPFVLKSDGTQKGMVQITLAYSMSVLNLLLSFLVIFLSTTLFCADLRDRVVFTLDTKPVHRWQMILGKWTGIMALNLVLLAFAGTAIYGLIRYMGRPIPGREEENLVLKTEVLTSRQMADMSMERGARGKDFIVPHNTEQFWLFENVRPHRNEQYVIVRFKHHSALRKEHEEQGIPGIWTVGDIEKGYYQNVLSLPEGETNEFRVPVQHISDEGKLHLRWRNLSADYATVIFPHGDVKVLYTAGSFGANFFRSLIMVFIRLSFLSIVGLATSTFLTFPVATLLTLFVFIMCLSLPSIIAMFSPAVQPPGLEQVAEGQPFMVLFMRRAVVSILRILPNLRAYDPVPSLSDGLMIRWRTVLGTFVSTLLLRSGLICVLGCFVFRRRELANMGYE